jgi:hypothetical protein
MHGLCVCRVHVFRPPPTRWEPKKGSEMDCDKTGVTLRPISIEPRLEAPAAWRRGLWISGPPKIESDPLGNSAPTKSEAGLLEASSAPSLTKVVDMKPDIECIMSVPLNSQYL